MAKSQKNRASKAPYVSPKQLELVGFESPFTKHLDPNNRWVRFSKQIPRDKIANVYQRQLNILFTGADGINPRVAIGAIFIKHMCDLSDREAVQQIQENDNRNSAVNKKTKGKGRNKEIKDSAISYQSQKEINAIQYSLSQPSDVWNQMQY